MFNNVQIIKKCMSIMSMIDKRRNFIRSNSYENWLNWKLIKLKIE